MKGRVDMKAMTCKQLGGACEKVFEAETFEAMAEQSRAHGMEMLKQGDEAHIKAMKAMGELMESPEKMAQWMAEKKDEFEEQPDLE